MKHDIIKCFITYTKDKSACFKESYSNIKRKGLRDILISLFAKFVELRHIMTKNVIICLFFTEIYNANLFYSLVGLKKQKKFTVICEKSRIERTKTTFCLYLKLLFTIKPPIRYP